MSVFARLAWFFRAQWRRYLTAIALLLVVALLQLLPPRLVGTLIDRTLAEPGSLSSQWPLLGLLLGIGLLIYLLRIGWRLQLYGAAYRLSCQLRQQLFAHFLRLPLSRLGQDGTGDLMALATNDVQAVEQTAGDGVLTLVDGLLMGCLVLVVLFLQYPAWLILLALAPLPLMAWLLSRLGKRLHGRFGQAQAAFGQLNNQCQEALTGIRVVKSYAVEPLTERRFARHNRQAVDANLAVAQIEARFEPVIYLCIGGAYLLAIGGGGVMVAQGSLSVGQLTSFSLYLGQLIWPMFALAWLMNIIQKGSAAYGRIEALLALSPALPAATDPLPLPPGRTLRLDIARHGPADHPWLSQIQAELSPGRMLGLVGRSGSGKSTLLRLLLRFEDPSAGQLTLDGIAVSRLDEAQWRDLVAYVPQEPFLFSTSIADNLALGKPDASQAELEAVARLACVHHEILAFPEGYATLVGERGITLSGGQKQRLCLARALLRDAPILVLDDALSAVDAQTEQAILSLLRQACAHRLLVITSHRLCAVQGADEILVLEQGRIRARGQHSELLASLPWYRQLWDYQSLQADLGLVEEVVL
ncbi:ABC transporter transmembrane domain-containing protein [Pseudaeromonas paramecii]|uniref:ABC transporter transmembrane domain-containing protein n=1 Tax=Pseudaeromonas paramecii TaxID=2138166 RepID=A0ABP8PTN2_9GAMM